jgi:hypothetical protein
MFDDEQPAAHISPATAARARKRDGFIFSSIR